MTVTGSVPFPFITKEGSLGSFKTTTTSQFNSDFSYGDAITGSYPYSTSITSEYYSSEELVDFLTRKKNLLALKNTLNYYSRISPHYAFSSSLGDKERQELMLVSIPSIFYGQKIKKGSLSCKWYYTGSLIGELRDVEENGELRQVFPRDENYNKVAGVALYKEGFLLITGSWSLHDSYVDRFVAKDFDTDYSPSWKFFMTTGSAENPITQVPSSSFILDFDGTEKIPVITMFAKADKAEFNYSNNPTFLEHGNNQTVDISTKMVRENYNLKIKNIVSSIYEDEEPRFEKITYISKVAIYDKDKNLIGIAKLANPVMKKQNENLAIKMKLDM